MTVITSFEVLTESTLAADKTSNPVYELEVNMGELVLIVLKLKAYSITRLLAAS